MPQFDLYAWASVAFWVIFSFQVCYLLLLRYVISRVSEFQKMLQKVSGLYSFRVVDIFLKDILIARQLRRH